MALSKSQVKSILADVPNNKQFYLTNNKGILRNLQDLEDALLNMDDMTFNFHVTKDRNDFATWVKDTLGDQTLAQQLASTKQKEKMYGFVYTRLSQLNYIGKRGRPKPVKHSHIRKIHEKIKSMIRKKTPEEKNQKLAQKSLFQKQKELKKKEKEIKAREDRVKRFESKLVKKKKEIIIKEMVQGVLIGILISIMVLLILSRYLEICL